MCEAWNGTSSYFEEYGQAALSITHATSIYVQDRSKHKCQFSPSPTTYFVWQQSGYFTFTQNVTLMKVTCFQRYTTIQNA